MCSKSFKQTNKKCAFLLIYFLKKVWMNIPGNPVFWDSFLVCMCACMSHNAHLFPCVGVLSNMHMFLISECESKPLGSNYSKHKLMIHSSQLISKHVCSQPSGWKTSICVCVSMCLLIIGSVILQWICMLALNSGTQHLHDHMAMQSSLHV